MKNYLWHRFIYEVLRYTAGPILKRAFRYKCKKQKGPDKASLIICNHNADLDPALVGLGFSKQMYYLASEHAFRNGFASKVLRFVFAPIPINKTRPDVSAVKEIIRRLRAGANVCLFAEGNRSFNGRTAPLALSTAKLVRTSGVDLITFKITGGYFTTPRWSKIKRKGLMTGAMVGKYTAAEIKTMTDGQILGVIDRDIYEDAYERQKEKPVAFHCKNPAENIETTLYLCPGCIKIGTIKSSGDTFACDCGMSGVYTETGFLEGDALPFTTITEWDLWQQEKLAEIIEQAGDEPICSDEGQMLFAVRVAVDKTLAGEGTMSIDRGSLHIAGLTFPLENITQLAVAGQMTLLFGLTDGATYEVRSILPRSALKYREIFRILTQKSD